MISEFAIVTNDQEVIALAQQYNLPYFDDGALKQRFILSCDEHIILRDNIEKLSFELNFVETLRLARSKDYRKNDLYRAISNLDKEKIIYDLTAGFARDAMLMALSGYTVHMIEDNVIVFFMVRLALAKLASDGYQDIASRLQITHADSLDFLNSDDLSDEVFYLDPMFPQKNKKLKVKKDMQFLQNICDKKDNAYELVKAAKRKGKVILKRPINAPTFPNLPANYVIKGSKIRFDVF